MARTLGERDVSALTSEQTQDVLRFLLYRMTMDQRRKLMAAQPVAYATLYPEVNTETITESVSAAIADARIGGHL